MEEREQMKSVRLSVWVAVFLSVVITGCMTTGKKVEARKVTHFWFDYNYQPHPGKRVWMLVNPKIWVEFYPNGLQSRYKVLDRTAVDGKSGTIVSKFSGDTDETQTLNEGSFEAFIPDKGDKLPLYFRHRMNGQWSDWQLLTDINIIE